MMILPSVIMPPAPIPHAALARMKLVMLLARAHHRVLRAKITIVTRYGGFLPRESDILPRRGWKAVEVSRNAVDNHEALLDDSKYDVMTG